MSGLINPKTYVLCFTLLLSILGFSQDTSRVSFWEPADSLNRGRLRLLVTSGAVGYSAAAVGLYSIWYKNYDLEPFHAFDDYGEWENMDKAGHSFTAYAYSYQAFKGMRWAGVRHKPAVWIGAGVGTLLQTTIEVMDGFSERWGFSWYDMGFNTLGVALFAGQEFLWEEQRIQLKVSQSRPNYNTIPVKATNAEAYSSMRDAAYGLFGRSLSEAFIKDYNGLTVWMSINPASFLSRDNQRSIIPRWLNLAAGVSAENVFGAYGNVYTDPQGRIFPLYQYPRYRQYFLSLDVDLRRIRTRSPFLKSVFSGLSWLKFPAPALEWNTLGKRRFRWLYW